MLLRLPHSRPMLPVEQLHDVRCRNALAAQQHAKRDAALVAVLCRGKQQARHTMAGLVWRALDVSIGYRPAGRKRLSWPGVGSATVRRGSGPSDGGHASATRVSLRPSCAAMLQPISCQNRISMLSCHHQLSRRPVSSTNMPFRAAGEPGGAIAGVRGRAPARCAGGAGGGAAGGAAGADAGWG